MTTQKDVIRIFKATNGLLDVVSFSGEKRISSYGNLNMIQAIKEVALRNKCNPEYTVLIVDKRTAPCASWDKADYIQHVVDFNLFN